MNVFVVLVVLGKVAAVIGPWPADLENCRSNEAKSREDIDRAFADPKKLAKIREGYPGLTREQTDWHCVERAVKPHLGDAL